MASLTFPNSRHNGLSLYLHILAGFGLLYLFAVNHAAIASAKELGGDEHFEVTKAFLWGQGSEVYARVWNDQPPVFTVLLGIIFRVFGTEIAVARCFAAIFGVALLVGLYVAVWRRAGTFPAYIAVLTLLAAPGCFELFVSVMLEVPAVAIGFFALPLIDLWVRWRSWLYFVASGIVFACALQTKLTAAILLPALGVELMLVRYSAGWFNRQLYLILWLIIVVGVYLILGATFGANYSTFWQSHFYGGLNGAADAEHFSFDWRLLIAQPEAILGSLLAVVAVWRTRNWQLLLFPGTLLVTAVIVHVVHRPYWSYYGVHFALPMAWLTGYGINTFINGCSSYWQGAYARLIRQNWTARIVASLAIAFHAEMSIPRLLGEIHRIQTRPTVAGDPVLSAMHLYSARTKWIYTTLPMYAFHAKIPIIPELAVLPLKRFWCGQMDNRTVASKVYEYRPEQLLFSVNARPIPELLPLLREEYILVFSDEVHSLWIARRIVLECKGSIMFFV